MHLYLEILYDIYHNKHLDFISRMYRNYTICQIFIFNISKSCLLNHILKPILVENVKLSFYFLENIY